MTFTVQYTVKTMERRHSVQMSVMPPLNNADSLPTSEVLAKVESSLSETTTLMRKDEGIPVMPTLRAVTATGRSSHGENTKRRRPVIAAITAMSWEKLRPKTIPTEPATVPAVPAKPL